ncbi:MAG TPA: SRPBCC family protein [Solirubrobacteraceae bacterium]|nr:SRPBCC family protein [Solirubrobacteraceae bacterium]
MVELDRTFQIDRPAQDAWALVMDLERLVPCVQGGKVLERISDDEVRAEIRVKMGAMSMRFAGTVTIVERDDEQRRALLRVKSREVGGSGHANADVTFTLQDGSVSIHTAAQITGKAASMGEGTVATVLEALIKDFSERFAAAV